MLKLLGVNITQKKEGKQLCKILYSDIHNLARVFSSTLSKINFWACAMKVELSVSAVCVVFLNVALTLAPQQMCL